MLLSHRIGALLLMGGHGSRFGSELPKQFHLLRGNPIYLHTLNIFLKCGWIDEIVLASHSDWIEEVRREIPSKVKVIEGGATRQESSWNGLHGFEIEPQIVLIHDAVRPFVTEKILRDNVEMAIEKGAADTCIPSTDTLVFAPNGNQIEKIPHRAHFLRGQTPQTFRFEWILDAHKKARAQGVENASDDCRLTLDAGYPIQVVMGDETNLKITTAFDLRLAENLEI